MMIQVLCFSFRLLLLNMIEGALYFDSARMDASRDVNVTDLLASIRAANSELYQTEHSDDLFYESTEQVLQQFFSDYELTQVPYVMFMQDVGLCLSVCQSDQRLDSRTILFDEQLLNH